MNDACLNGVVSRFGKESVVEVSIASCITSERGDKENLGK